ncbi:MAG: UDP-3-O-(3-hydroxymyristoyl)glucosamine N-acyltransferase [Bdellovibrionota bacterium]
MDTPSRSSSPKADSEFSVTQILDWTGGRLVNSGGKGGPEGEALRYIRVKKPAPLDGSCSTDLSFFFSREYESELVSARPGILITGEAFVKPLERSGLPLWSGSAVIACKDPYFAMALISEKFAVGTSDVVQGIHQTAVVDPSVEISPGVKIGPHCVIEKGVRIGARSVLYAGCYVGSGSVLGVNAVVFPNVTIYEGTVIGSGVRIHAGTVIGADGFGYAPITDGGSVVGHQKIYHLGRVVIGDDVEIGANSCIDRSTFGETRVDSHAKLDNHVHVGHNAHVGEGAIICGGTCLAGNAKLGKYAYVGGLTGITNHVRVGDGAKVGAMSLLTKDVPPGGVVLGNPQRDHKEYFRAHALLSRLLAERRKQ